ncbi:MAG: hypothetical protein JKY98_01270 [Gammaproteobacteria bacterium]|nr:hypothetical protein [Gammaproteobacteria bacterium]
MRTLMAIDNGELTTKIGFQGLLAKLREGLPLTEQEEINLRLRMDRQLRYFENLHYHWQLGVLDEEIWQANLAGISGMHRSPGFTYLHSEWPDGFGASIFRRSFVELVVSFRE